MLVCYNFREWDAGFWGHLGWHLPGVAHKHKESRPAELGWIAVDKHSGCTLAGATPVAKCLARDCRTVRPWEDSDSDIPVAAAEVRLVAQPGAWAAWDTAIKSA